MVIFLLVLVLFVAVIAAVASPWRWSDGTEHRAADDVRAATVLVVDLEAERDAKYREIRDAELDHETGKLSAADFDTVDASLRAEAVEILKRLDRAQKRLDALERREADGVAPVLASTDPEPVEATAPSEGG